MKQTASPKFSVAAKVFSLATISLLMSACGTEKEAPAPIIEKQQEITTTRTENSRPTMHWQGFFMQIMSSVNDGSEGELTLKLPAIWMFSPQGQMSRIVLDDEGLKTFAMDFSVAGESVPGVSCQMVDEAVTASTANTWSLGCQDDKWTALLLLPADPDDVCRSCERFEAALGETEKENPDSLQSSVVVLNF